MISDAFPYESHFVDVLGSQMHYVEEGSGDPLLSLWAKPGMIIRGEKAARQVAVMFPNTETVFVGKGRHYSQEDQPDAIREALSDWLGRTA